jgi:hypothetical protein
MNLIYLIKFLTILLINMIELKIRFLIIYFLKIFGKEKLIFLC